MFCGFDLSQSRFPLPPAQALLKNQEVDPNERHAFGWTALHVAAVGGQYEAVEALLARGADPDAGDGYSTAFRAGRDLRLPAVEAMVVREKEFSDVLNHNKSYKNCTPLHYAVLADSAKCVKALLDAGASPLEVRIREVYEHRNQATYHLLNLSISVNGTIFKTFPSDGWSG